MVAPCWFCKSREGSPGSEREVRLSKKTGFDVQHTTIPIPRCRTCREGHTRSQLIGCAGGMALGSLVAGVLALWRPAAVPTWLIGVLAVLAMGLGFQMAGRRSGLPPGQEPEKAALQHPDVRAALQAGWVPEDALLRE